MRTEHNLHYVMHAGCFALLTALMLNMATRMRTWLLLVGCLGALAIGGEYIEHIQGHFPIETSDVMTDFVGILLGVLAGLLPKFLLSGSPSYDRSALAGTNSLSSS